MVDQDFFQSWWKCEKGSSKVTQNIAKNVKEICLHYENVNFNPYKRIIKSLYYKLKKLEVLFNSM